MKQLSLLILSASFAVTAVSADSLKVSNSPNGIAFPDDYPDWRVISITHRVDNQTMRVILGNDIAVKAARAGTTNPWPDGAVLGKVVWKQTEKSDWKTAIAPDRFVHAEFMFKDSGKWSENGTGWGVGALGRRESDSLWEKRGV